jgi:predicted CopG family antitoxin
VAHGLGGSNSFGMLLHEKHTRTSLNEVLAKLTKRKKLKKSNNTTSDGKKI